MGILSKAKSVAKKAVSNLVGNVKALTGTTKVQTYTPPKTLGTITQANINQAAANANKLGIGNISSSIGGVTTAKTVAPSTPKAKSMDFPTLPGASYSNPSAGNQSLMKDSSGNYSVVSSSLTRSGPINAPVSSKTSTSTSTITPTASTTSTYSAPVNVASVAETPDSPTIPNAPATGLGVPTAASNMANVGAVDAAGNPVQGPLVTDPAEKTTEPDKYAKMIEDAMTGLTGNKPEKTDYGRADAMESSGYNDALAQANDLSNQISAINAQAESSKLSLIGQGRGIPEAIIGGQQAKIDREAAIKTMPLTAQYKASVGLVDAAKEIVSNFVADERAYQQSIQQWQKDVFSSVYQYATTQQKAALDEKNRLTDRQYKLEDDFRASQQKASDLAIESGQGDLLTGIWKATNAQELAGTSSKIKSIDAKIKNLDLQNKVLTNQKLQAEVAAADPVNVAAGKQSELASIMGLADSIMNDDYLNNVVGIKTPGAWFNGWVGSLYGSNTGKVQNEIKQLQASLSLDARAKLKGSGAISDFEARTLERSTNAFGTNLSNGDAMEALKDIKGVAATAAGLAVPVKITNPTTGKSQIVTANRNGIDKAISQNYLVEYQ